jgi:hypothetical protein
MSRLDSRARFLSRSGLGTCGFTEVMEQAFEVFAAMLFAIAASLLIPAAWTAYTPRHRDSSAVPAGQECNRRPEFSVDKCSFMKLH